MSASGLTQDDQNIIEILATWVANYAVVACYGGAQRQKNTGKSETISEGYKIVLDQYMMMLHKDEKWIKTQLESIAVYYSEHRYSGGLESIIEKWSNILIPKDYISSASYKQKLGKFIDVFRKCCISLIKEILKPINFKDVIDNRRDKTLTVRFKDIFKNLVLVERETIYSQIAQVRNGKKPTYEDTQTDQIRKMHEIIKKLKDQNLELIANQKKLTEQYNREVKKTAQLLSLLKSGTIPGALPLVPRSGTDQLKPPITEGTIRPNSFDNPVVVEPKPEPKIEMKKPRITEPKPEPKLEPKPEPKPEVKKPEIKKQAAKPIKKPDPAPAMEPESVKPEPKQETISIAELMSEPEPKSEPKSESPSEQGHDEPAPEPETERILKFREQLEAETEDPDFQSQLSEYFS